MGSASPRDEDFWVFGYGSLMWRPGFDFIDSALAWVHGYHRALCIFSHVHRGTPERPGLVLGLDHGGSCQGVAFKSRPRPRRNDSPICANANSSPRSIWRKRSGCALSTAAARKALAYIVDRTHIQYAGRLPVDEMIRLIAEGVGLNGDNPAYVRNTYEHLLRLDIHDAELAEVVRRLDHQSCRAAGPATGGAGDEPTPL